MTNRRQSLLLVLVVIVPLVLLLAFTTHDLPEYATPEFPTSGRVYLYVGADGTVQATYGPTNRSQRALFAPGTRLTGHISQSNRAAYDTLMHWSQKTLHPDRAVNQEADQSSALTLVITADPDASFRWVALAWNAFVSHPRAEMRRRELRLTGETRGVHTEEPRIGKFMFFPHTVRVFVDRVRDDSGLRIRAWPSRSTEEGWSQEGPAVDLDPARDQGWVDSVRRIVAEGLARRPGLQGRGGPAGRLSGRLHVHGPADAGEVGLSAG